MGGRDESGSQRRPTLPQSAQLADSIGLAGGSVMVVDYDERWPDAYAELAELLTEVLPPNVAAIEHVGSTSVPGLAAKPILDIAIGLRGSAASTAGSSSALAYDDLVERIVGLGFSYRGDFEEFGGRLFLAETGPELVAVHVHVVDFGSTQWERYLAFRDGLREDPALAAEYVELKRALAAEHATDRAAYTEAKFDFVFQHAEELAARRR